MLRQDTPNNVWSYIKQRKTENQKLQSNNVETFYGMTIQMKATKWYFSVILYPETGASSYWVCGIFKCDDLNESNLTVCFCGTV